MMNWIYTIVGFAVVWTAILSVSFIAFLYSYKYIKLFYNSDLFKFYIMNNKHDSEFLRNLYEMYDFKKGSKMLIMILKYRLRNIKSTRK